MKVIRAVAFANGTPCSVAGMYLSNFDANAHGGRGWADYTLDLRNALTFRDAPEAFNFWRTVSSVKPVRDDGKPNRPLTSTTVEIVDLPAAP